MNTNILKRSYKNKLLVSIQKLLVDLLISIQKLLVKYSKTPI